MTDSDPIDNTRIVGPPAAPDDPGTPYLIVLNGQLAGELLTLVDHASYVIGRGDDADFRLIDAGISRHHALVSVDGERVLVEDLRSTNGTTLNGDRLTAVRELADGDKLSVGTATILKFTWHGALPPTLTAKSHRDPLSGAYREKYFHEHLHAEHSFSRRHQTPLSLILFDIDHFYSVCHTHGGDLADRLIADVGRQAAKLVANRHLLSRLGNRRFAVLCRDVTSAAACALAEQLRVAIAEMPVTAGARSLSVTISAGVGSLPWSLIDSADAFVRLVEYALVDAKNAGHNRVVAANPTAEQR
jgi:diguanylate cyclase (GGDEF)-like protein